ncbi:flagellar biosynthesis protein [Desulfitispora alkaliphila]|uniref:EscU/YscU/HrcU family type III secretion system export apparatus switch protein n=1 Tax=Desulfitispora alkaliphila TaxID=622674 RepID=UPI003D19AB35
MDKENKKLKTAVALKYCEGDIAPKIVARGNNQVAESIIRLAKDNEVPLHMEPELVNVLQDLNIGEEIPEDLYYAVAEILVFIKYLEK